MEGFFTITTLTCNQLILNFVKLMLYENMLPVLKQDRPRNYYVHIQFTVFQKLQSVEM